MTDPENQRLDRIEAILERLAHDLEEFKEESNKNRQESNKNLEELRQEMARTNDRVEIYQKASQQVVNLAFGLLATAAASIIIPAILNTK
jgi:serine phosphatase RsbU (regulator of sigma subunit)